MPPFKVYMSQSLYKLATPENHTYETEGVFYLYEVCDESEIDAYVKQGWSVNFSDLKGEQHESKETSSKETSNEKTDEEVLSIVPAKRGRKPKVQ